MKGLMTSKPPRKTKKDSNADNVYITQLGSKQQHEVVKVLAKKAGYKGLRFLLADYYKLHVINVYRVSMPEISVREAANIITALRNGLVPSEYVIRAQDNGYEERKLLEK